jgi:hypothetical protein
MKKKNSFGSLWTGYQVVLFNVPSHQQTLNVLLRLGFAALITVTLVGVVKLPCQVGGCITTEIVCKICSACFVRLTAHCVCLTDESLPCTSVFILLMSFLLTSSIG